jgi:hypothetical protein
MPGSAGPLWLVHKFSKPVLAICITAPGAWVLLAHAVGLGTIFFES